MDHTYRVLVGVDGSFGGRLALRWAVAEATQRGGAVQAVIAWQWEGPVMAPAIDANPEAARERAARILTEEVEAIRAELGSHIPVAIEVVQGDPATVLTRAAGDADLLVLGSHGHGRLHHMVLGSVSEQCIRQARCPVVVLPVPKPAPAPAEPAVRTAS